MSLIDSKDYAEAQAEIERLRADNADTLAELQEANDEVTRLRRLVIDNTCANDGGKRYWPQWVVNGLIGPLPGGE